MKIYWENREGKPSPNPCDFFLHPFDAPKIYWKDFTRVDSLPPPGKSPVKSRRFFPEKKEWIRLANAALEKIEKGPLKKIVLARENHLELYRKPDPFKILASLKSKAYFSYLFCLQTDRFSFLGASPERLFLRENDILYTEALAGTRRRGETEEEDILLEKQLLQSEKERREFRFVQKYLKKSLSPFVSHGGFSPIEVKKTSHVQHLYSAYKGWIKTPSFDGCKTLHPTPALLGTPEKAAWEALKKLEPFPRGFFGGVVGWEKGQTSECCVAIRSCLIEEKDATLFSGAGIVKGSDPEKEWEELNEKLKLYDGIFVD